MPLARYFLLVGGVLLLALLVAGAVLPSPQAVEQVETKRAEIHIHSAMKLPERVVFDTSAPAVAPRVDAVTAEAAPPSAENVTARARQAFAQVQSPDPSRPKLSDPKRPGPKAAHSRKTQTRHATGPRKIRFARHQPFDWFGNRMWW